jgi:hypothetical protein
MSPRAPKAILEDLLQQIDDLIEKAAGTSLDTILIDRDL